MQDASFWKHKQLNEMSSEEWEALCDGCGKCCVLKLEDIDSGDVYYTDVGCKLLNCDTCVCKDYSNRKQIVPDCVILTPDNLTDLKWMPKTCAYRLIFEHQDLPEWHPLVTGDKDSTRISGNAVAGRIYTEKDVPESELPNHITEW